MVLKTDGQNLTALAVGAESHEEGTLPVGHSDVRARYGSETVVLSPFVVITKVPAVVSPV